MEDLIKHMKDKEGQNRKSRRTTPIPPAIGFMEYEKDGESFSFEIDLHDKVSTTFMIRTLRWATRAQVDVVIRYAE